MKTLLACLLFAGCSCAQSLPSVRAGFAYRNTVNLGDIQPGPVREATTGLLALLASGEKEITLRIHSTGGSIFLGHGFMLLAEDAKKRAGARVTCIVDGAAYSMAAVILESPVCDVRLATSRSTILFHNGSGTAEGTAEQMRDMAAFLDTLNEAMANVISERTGIPIEAYRARIAHGDWQMATAEALAYNVIDAVVSPTEIAPPN
jgi:ATP-dependent Clp protease protease subunit